MMSGLVSWSSGVSQAPMTPEVSTMSGLILCVEQYFPGPMICANP